MSEFLHPSAESHVKTAQALALRARIVLLSAAGHSNTQVARRVHVSLATVGKWRQRFVLLTPRRAAR